MLNPVRLQGEFNAEFVAAKQRKQAELDKIVEASNRMAAISEELAHMGVAVGEGQGGPGWTHMADDADDSVLTVKVADLDHCNRVLHVSIHSMYSSHCSYGK